MQRILSWDYPVRVLHWGMAFGALGAWSVAQLAERDGALFPLHMLLGLLALGALVLRLIWAVVGTPNARFSALPLAPSALLNYLKQARHRQAPVPRDHNPATAWASLGFFALIAGLGVTGLLLIISRAPLGELHGTLAGVLLGLTAVHLAGVLWHSFRHREPLVTTMLTGRKLGEVSWAIASARPIAGLVMLGLLVSLAGGLFASWNPPARTLSLPGRTLMLHGEERESGEEREHGEGHH